MRTTIAFALGVLTGLAFSIPARRAVIRYAEHSLPQPEYSGAKASMRYFNGGVEVPILDWSAPADADPDRLEAQR